MSQSKTPHAFRPSIFGRIALLMLLGISLCAVSQAETNTPFAAGTRVSITSEAGTVAGILQDVTDTDWVGVIEHGSTEPTYIRGSDLIVRRFGAAPNVPAPAPAADEHDEFEDATSGHYIY